MIYWFFFYEDLLITRERKIQNYDDRSYWQIEVYYFSEFPFAVENSKRLKKIWQRLSLGAWARLRCFRYRIYTIASNGLSSLFRSYSYAPCRCGALRTSLNRSEWRASVQLSWFSYRVPPSTHREVKELGKWSPNKSVGRRTSRFDFVIACAIDASGRGGIGNWHKLRGLIVRDELIRTDFTAM